MSGTPDVMSSSDATISYSSAKDWFRRFRRSFSGKKLPALLGVGVLFIGLAAGVFAVINGYDVRIGASATGVDLSFVPADKQLAIEETATWDIFINTHNHAVTSTQLELNFDNNLFDFVSLVAGTTLNETIVSGVAFGNRAFLTLGVKPVMTNPGPPPVYEITPFLGTGTLAKLTLKAKAGVSYGQANLSFASDRGDGTGTIALTREMGSTNVIGDLTPATMTVGTPPPSPSPSPVPSVSPSPVASPSPSVAPSPSVLPSPTPSPSVLPSPSPSVRPSPTPTPTPSPTPRPSPSPSPVASAQPSRSPKGSPIVSVAPSPIPSPSPIVTNDTVNVVRARVVDSFFRRLLVRIEVVATSSQQPNANLSVLNYGSMRFDSRANVYSKTFWVIAPPPRMITVVSSKGGRADAVVDTSYLNQ